MGAAALQVCVGGGGGSKTGQGGGGAAAVQTKESKIKGAGEGSSRHCRLGGGQVGGRAAAL